MIAKVIHRFIDIARRLGFINKSYTLAYSGKGVSINQYYNSNHWQTRKGIKDKYGKIADDLILAEIPSDEYFNEFGVIITYWSRHDPDNVTGLEKIIIDGLKKRNHIEDDGRKFYKLYMVIPDDTLPHNTFNIEIIKFK